jgi:hypothetical protein
VTVVSICDGVPARLFIFGTSLERIAAESVTHSESAFVHGHISGCHPGFLPDRVSGRGPRDAYNYSKVNAADAARLMAVAADGEGY